MKVEQLIIECRIDAFEGLFWTPHFMGWFKGQEFRLERNGNMVKVWLMEEQGNE